MISDVELLAELRPKLRRRAADMLGSQTRHVDDLAQEGWIAVWRALPTRPVSVVQYDEIVGWCIGVARNRMRNWIRDELAAPRRGMNREVSAGSGTDSLIEALSESESTETVDAAYHHGELAAAFDALSPRQRQYVIARFWHGLKGVELDVALGVRKATAALWNGPYRARERMAKELLAQR